MGKKLIIAEKPSVARDIAEALGGFAKVEGWYESPVAIVSSAIGHLVEIYSSEAATAGRDLATLPVIPGKFELQPIEKMRSQFSLVSRLMRRQDVDEVVNACDAGREGELIFRLIYELAGCSKPTRRLWLQSMTADAIRGAYRAMRPGAEYNNLGDAARCRSEADWLIGINGSRGLTRLWERQTRAYDVLSAGRVQTPTLAILVHHEHRIRTFVPQDYWEVHARFSVQAGTYVGKWCRPDPVGGEPDAEPGQGGGTRLFDLEEATRIATKCRSVSPSEVRDVSSASTTPPPRLFDLTSLQREANLRFKFSAKQTLDIAQALYEVKKAISYPRTDATALPEDYLGTVREVLGVLDGPAYAPHAAKVLGEGWVRPDKRIFDNTKIADHFAIIPTMAKPHGLNEPEARLYDMIVRRFIAAFFPAAEYRLTKRTTVVAGEEFRSAGRVLVAPGWLEVYGTNDADDKTPPLCHVVAGEQVRTEAVEVRALRTQPPTRYTEGALLAAMEGAGKLVEDDDLREAMKERGLGTPATRANIIEGLLHDRTTDRNGKERQKEPYVTREGDARHLVPTAKGMGLIEFLEANGIEALTSPRMTGEWETKLRLMEQGRYRRNAFMDEIRDLTRSIIEVIRAKASEAPAGAATACLEGSACPKCGSALLASPRTFECRAGCGFKLWREVCGRTLSEDEGRQLLRDGAIPNLDGFISPRTKRQFSAGLRLDAPAGKVELVFEEREAPTGGPPPAQLSVPCPKCGSAIHVLSNSYSCSGSGCGVRLRRQVAGREMAAAEVERLLATKSHPTLDGFTSSKGRRFSAGLRLSQDMANVEFQFE